MRINRIKISGFKSFVDPTTLSLPGNLTGVVGPNGCGKSNIIDALIWVMGESSAKHLRGDSMTDVIFNGSNTRKPVGQSTVEIVFDNTDGTIGGQYAGFGEISIKRSLARDGASNYFLNGSRCRRKDITNVFLGTGIGARGYSVIEQGMISRVIEARPEELRSFLEEAAGISKYKERRRETENRMRHTLENIERLDDIREELDKQLKHLQRQARAAERYQVLKGEERTLNAKLIAARWRSLESDREKARQLTASRRNELEACVTELRELESHQTSHREAQSEATESFNQLQSEFYARSSTITQLEQALKHSDEREQALSQDLAQSRRLLDEAQLAVGKDEQALQTLEANANQLAPQTATAKQAESRAGEALTVAESALEQWQQQWDEFNRKHSEFSKSHESTRVRLEHLLSGLNSSDQRQKLLSDEAGRNDTSELGPRITALREAIASLEQQQQQLNTDRQNVRQALGESRELNSKLTRSLHEKHSELEQQGGRLASLKALQEEAFGGDLEATEQWLRQQGVAEVSRLAEKIEIESGWEAALEAALMIPLGSLCGPDLVGRYQATDPLTRPKGASAVINTGSNPNTGGNVTSADTQSSARNLLSKITSNIDFSPLLGHVYIAESASAALAMLDELRAGEIVVTPDGSRYGHNWLTSPAQAGAEDNVLSRERRINELTTVCDALTRETSELRQQIGAASTRLNELEREEHKLGETLEKTLTERNEKSSEVHQLEAEFERRQARAQDVSAELERLAAQSTANAQQISELKQAQNEAEQTLKSHAAEQEKLSSRRREVQAEVDSARQSWRQCREVAHQLELRGQQLKAEREALTGAIERNTSAHQQQLERCTDLETAITGLNEPRQQMQRDLEAALAARLSVDNQLTEAKQALGKLDETMRQAQQQRAEIEQQINTRQQRLEQVRLDERALEVRQQELLSRFEQTEENFEETLASLGEHDSEASVTEALEKLASRIARLGPINLAAIDEFDQLSERKTYLDQQHSDLTEALNTLQEAIRKIDLETRTRFKETYDKVNNGLQAMFPVLFGGGHAYLELTGDDLLETGVTVMARPPGKRNSTIHLLSGGEKALTALAFVFSIFELNPAPFCLLDEVDAPLDDANVVRLTEMLKSMASNVQFLFISHNKITMEIAEQLIGVTMQEAGVSRLVSVDMEQAVELAATA